MMNGIYDRNTQSTDLEQTHIKSASCWFRYTSITYSKCAFVALVTQHAKGLGCVILSSVAPPAVQLFSTLSHKREMIFGKKC